MLKLLIFILSFSVITPSFAQEAPTYNCMDLYTRVIAKKKDNRKVQDNLGELLAIPGLVISFATGTAPIYLSGLGTMGLVKLIRRINGIKEENAVKLILENSKQFKKLMEKVNKKKAATAEQVLAITQRGFNSGAFCSNNRLASFNQIKRYVIKKL